jgi:hypothetical protein
MASATTFTCDGCQRSLSANDTLIEVKHRGYRLGDEGERYLGTGSSGPTYERLDLELCGTCGEKAKAAVQRALDGRELVK